MTDREREKYIVEEIAETLDARLDGAGRNLISNCPVCGKKGKFGVYVGKDAGNKRKWMSHCFSCHHSTRTLKSLLELIDRLDLWTGDTTNINMEMDFARLFGLQEEEEIDDDLVIAELPEYYKRTFTDKYLISRGWTYDDFDFFEAGTTRGCNFKLDDYIILPIYDEGDVVDYVARHKWSKKDIDEHNRKAKVEGTYQILRYRNSTDNDFSKILYNYDNVIEDETLTVVLLEGVFDVVALTRKMDLYDNPYIVPVATFGKKISQTQIYKLQQKGVRTVVIAYDGDAVETIKKIADTLSDYFHVLIADIENKDDDIDSMTEEQIYDLFTNRLKGVTEYKLQKVQNII